jgi:hypothetical protein
VIKRRAARSAQTRTGVFVSIEAGDHAATALARFAAEFASDTKTNSSPDIPHCLASTGYSPHDTWPNESART